MIKIFFENLTYAKLALFISPKGFKFESFIADQTKTCASEYQTPGDNVQVQEAEICEEKCSSNLDCNYYFYSNNGWCNLYSACDTTRTPKQSGSTFRKRGNYVV